MTNSNLSCSIIVILTLILVIIIIIIIIIIITTTIIIKQIILNLNSAINKVYDLVARQSVMRHLSFSLSARLALRIA